MQGFEEYTKLSARAEAERHKVKIHIFLHNEDSPTLSKEIETIYNLSGAEVRQLVRKFRIEGLPIGSSSNGYFLAKTPTGLDTTIAHITARMEALAIIRRSLLTSRSKLIGDSLEDSMTQELLF